MQSCTITETKLIMEIVNIDYCRPIWLAEAEAALDKYARGGLYARMSRERWWRLRRNGQTKTWKTRPSEFRIPVKAGLRVTTYVTHTDDVGPVAKFAFGDQLPNSVKA